jgi:ATP phosphoribosyltransferase
VTRADAPLKLGIPKGSLEKSTIELFAKAGWRISTSGRSYFPTIDDPGIRCSLMRPQEMSRYIEAGVLDGGITGHDWIVENGSQVHQVCDLLYSKVTLQGTRWVLVVREDSPVQRPEDLRGGRVATELVHTTRRFFAERGIEAKVAEGLVDAIVDVTETGSTLRANQLRIVAELLPSSPQLVASLAAWEDPARREKLEQIALLLRGALEAQNQVGLKLNVRRRDLSAIIELVPSLTAPTISNLYQAERLHGEEWFSVESVIAEATVRDLIPKLIRAGATGIIEYPLNKVI